MNKYNYLIFDADRTIFDFDKAESMALSKICQNINIKYNEKILRDYREINHKYWFDFENGKIKQEIIKTARFKSFFEFLNINEDSEYYGDLYLTYLSKENYLLPHAYEVIKKLSNSYILILLTNGLSKVQHPRFNNSIIKKYFELFIVSEDVKLQKPDREIFQLIFSKLGITNLDKVLMIGDSLTSDIMGGINAKIHTCWYNIDKRDEKILIKPNYIINDLRELFNILGE